MQSVPLSSLERMRSLPQPASSSAEQLFHSSRQGAGSILLLSSSAFVARATSCFLLPSFRWMVGLSLFLFSLMRGSLTNIFEVSTNFRGAHIRILLTKLYICRMHHFYNSPPPGDLTPPPFDRPAQLSVTCQDRVLAISDESCLYNRRQRVPSVSLLLPPIITQLPHDPLWSDKIHALARLHFRGSKVGTPPHRQSQRILVR